MKKVILTKGLPASGKTTWAKTLVANSPGLYKRINKDDLRAMLDGGRWSKDNEKFVLKLRDQVILEALADGKHVIVDDTNLHPKHEAHIRQLVKGQAEVIIEDFTNVNVKVCIERDLQRPNSVGAKVITDMYNQFLKLEIAPLEQDTSLPQAFIFDVDGTLAKMNGRGAYDWDRVREDLPNQPVMATLKYLSEECKIIIVTGRDGSCEQETRYWLAEHDITYDDFYIREAGNTEKDYIIKRRMLDEIINEYNVIGVFDDRGQVVSMWREAGLTCFQVAEGDF